MNFRLKPEAASKFPLLENGNVIEVADHTIFDRLNLKVTFEGRNNRLVIGRDFDVSKALHFHFPSHEGSIIVGDRCYIGSGCIRAGHSCAIQIGNEVTATRDVFMEVVEGQSITVGEDCMLATGVILRASDGHPIFDEGTGDRVNITRSITIAGHVWVGDRATILGGAEIGGGSVIGAAALVKGSIPEKALAVGVPAKTIRTGIVWSRKGLKRVKPGELEHSSGIKGEYAIR